MGWCDKIVALGIETTAYALAEQKPDEYCALKKIPESLDRHTILNCDADIEWVKEKATWLFETAGLPLPPFEYEQTSLSNPEPFLLAYYEAANDEYVVIVSPSSNPKQFCRAGYQLICTLEIGNAGDFPTNVILRQDHEFLKAMLDPSRTPLVGHSQKIEGPGADEWLEGAYEERTEVEVEL